VQLYVRGNSAERFGAPRYSWTMAWRQVAVGSSGDNFPRHRDLPQPIKCFLQDGSRTSNIESLKATA